MKFIVEVSFPEEPFNTLVRRGAVGEKIGEVLGAIPHEIAYFTDSGPGRGLILVVELDDYAKLPHITEPLMLQFGAEVHYRVAISPEQIASAGLERYATV